MTLSISTSSILFSLLMYLVFIGWGYILAALLRRKEIPHWGLLAGWGMALVLALAGIQNLFALITPLAIHSCLLIGGAAFAVYLKRSEACRFGTLWPGKSIYKWGVVIAGILLMWLVGITFLSVQSVRINPHDDLHAYLSFPHRMLQTGTTGIDPFNLRGLMSFGGQSYLHAIYLLKLGATALRATDLILGWLVFLGLVVAHGARRQARPDLIILVLFCCQIIYLPYQGIVNISSVMTGLALFYALFETFASAHETKGMRDIVPVAVIAAGICSLKHSYIPPCGVGIVLLCLCGYRETFRRKLIGLILVGLGTALCLLPWMIRMRMSCDTFLYPFLGRGLDGSSYGFFPRMTLLVSWELILHLAENLFTSTLFLVGLVSTGVIVFLTSARSERRVAITAWVAAWIAAPICLMSLSSRGNIPRHTLPYVYAASIFLLSTALYAFRTLAAKPGRRTGVYTYLPTVLLLIFVTWTHGGKAVRHYTRLARSGLQQASGAALTKDRCSVAQLQTTLPVGATVLARLSQPQFLDFSRNTVYLIDWPGGMSPPPGLNCQAEPEAIATYLRKQSIRYILYSYSDEAAFQEHKFGQRLQHKNESSMGEWRRESARQSLAFQDKVQRLSQSYNRTDNGRAFVLDLERPLEEGGE